MHWSGKVFVGLVVIGAAAAIALSARTHQIRRSWHKSLSKERADYGAGVDVLRKARYFHESAQVDLANAKRGWGDYSDDVTVTVNVQNGNLQTRDQETTAVLAASAAANQQQPIMVHGFLKNADGSVRFIGTFIQEGAAQGGFRTWKPTWKVRPADSVAAWASGKWRLRTLIPAHQKTRFVNLEVLLTQGDQTSDDKGLDARIKGAVDLKADEQLRLRFSELMGGNDDLAGLKGKLPDYMIDGLVRAIAAAEEERNQLIETVDVLRRDLKSNHDRANRLLKQNGELERSLPGSTSAAAAVTRNASAARTARTVQK
jgi:hypothetical protein